MDEEDVSKAVTSFETFLKSYPCEFDHPGMKPNCFTKYPGVGYLIALDKAINGRCMVAIDAHIEAI